MKQHQHQNPNQNSTSNSISKQIHTNTTFIHQSTSITSISSPSSTDNNVNQSKIDGLLADLKMLPYMTTQKQDIAYICMRR